MDHDELRDLLRIEFLRNHAFDSPWNCVEHDCPYFGRPAPKTGCKCFDDFESKHEAEVKRVLGIKPSFWG